MALVVSKPQRLELDQLLTNVVLINFVTIISDYLYDK